MGIYRPVRVRALPAVRHLPAGWQLVTRRFQAPPRAALAALSASSYRTGRHRIEFDTDRTTPGGGAELATGPGRLFIGGPRPSRFAPVEVDIIIWDDGTGELLIRPLSAAFGSWGARRLRRYFAAGQHVADDLVDLLGARANPAVPADLGRPHRTLHDETEMVA